MKVRALAICVLFIFALAACGGSDDSPAATAAATSADAVASDDLVDPDDVVDDAIDAGEELAEDLVDSLEGAQAANGGGSMTLTVGDQTWTYSPVLCAFGPEEIGQEGAEFVLSSIQDGTQMYATIDMFGHSVSLDDVQNFENPSVSLSSFGSEDFIVLDGKNFSGSAEFRDGTVDSFETIPGTFSGSCP